MNMERKGHRAACETELQNERKERETELLVKQNNRMKGD
jgi:hypothetical protein